MGKHRVDRPRRWGVVAGILGVGVLVAGVATTLVVLPGSEVPAASDEPQDCPGDVSTVRLAVTKAYQPVVEATDFGACITVEMSDADGFAGARALQDGQVDAWIPDSRIRGYAYDAHVAAAAPSLAVSPIVVSADAATTAALGEATDPWAALLSPDITVESQSTADSAVLLASADAIDAAVRAQGTDTYLGYAAIARALTDLRAQPVAALDEPVAPGVLRVSELRNADPERVLPSESGLPILDFPWIEPADTQPSEALSSVLDALTDAEETDVDHVNAMADSGLYSAGSAHIASGGTELAVRPGADSSRANLMFALADPSVYHARILTLIDVSGSMADVPAGGTLSGSAAVSEAMKLFATSMPDDLIIGGWAFGSQLDAPRDWIELNPPAPLGDTRDVVIDASTRIDARETGTALYRTFVDGYRDSLTNYEPDVLNVLAVFTDGKNEDDQTGTELATMLSEIGAIADPEKPIVPVFLGFGNSDLPAMTKITDALGGAIWQIDVPEQIVGAMVEAISVAGTPTVPAS